MPISFVQFKIESCDIWQVVKLKQARLIQSGLEPLIGGLPLEVGPHRSCSLASRIEIPISLYREHFHLLVQLRSS